MPLARKASKRYSVLIIPERGQETKRIELSRFMIRGTCVFVMIAVLSGTITATLFSNRYSNMIESSIVLEKQTDTQGAYIDQLQEELSEKQRLIDSQKQMLQEQEVYQKVIDGKLEEIDVLEKEVMEKLQKNKMFSQGELNDLTTPKVLSVAYTTKVSIEEVDARLERLRTLNSNLESLYEENQYVPSLWPASGRFTSGFGWRSNPFTSTGSEFHSGVDIANSYGTRVIATAKGSVVHAGYSNGYGNLVKIDHGNGLVSLYGHNATLDVKVGQVVEKGQTISRMGSTGRSTGVHVHFEIQKNGTAVNPYSILQ